MNFDHLRNRPLQKLTNRSVQKRLFQILAVLVIIGLIHNCKKIFATNLLAVTYMDEKYRNKGSTLKLFGAIQNNLFKLWKIEKRKDENGFWSFEVPR